MTDLGQYNFASSVIGYFALFAQLGISSYAVREGAGIRDNQEKTKEILWRNPVNQHARHCDCICCFLYVSAYGA